MNPFYNSTHHTSRISASIPSTVSQNLCYYSIHRICQIGATISFTVSPKSVLIFHPSFLPCPNNSTYSIPHISVLDEHKCIVNWIYCLWRHYPLLAGVYCNWDLVILHLQYHCRAVPHPCHASHHLAKPHICHRAWPHVGKPADDLQRATWPYIILKYIGTVTGTIPCNILRLYRYCTRTNRNFSNATWH